MANWYNYRLVVRGTKPAVQNFSRIALNLPLLSNYRTGKESLVEGDGGILIEKVKTWRNDISEQIYGFMSYQDVKEVIISISSFHPNLCFILCIDGDAPGDPSSEFIFREKTKHYTMPEKRAEEFWIFQYEEDGGYLFHDWELNGLFQALTMKWDNSTIKSLQK